MTSKLTKWRPLRIGRLYRHSDTQAVGRAISEHTLRTPGGRITCSHTQPHVRNKLKEIRASASAAKAFIQWEGNQCQRKQC